MRVPLKNNKGVSGGKALLAILVSCLIFNVFITTNSVATETESVRRVKEMGIESLYVNDQISVLTTPGGRFHVDLASGTIEIKQRIGKDRLLARVILTEDWFKALTAPNQDGFDCIWGGASPKDPKMIISGDSVIRFFNIEKLEVLLCFPPIHQAFNVSITNYNNGGLLVLDDNGGLAIIPPTYCSNKIWPKTFKGNVWKLTAEESLPFLFIGILPPRSFDWDRSFMPVIHYSSHVQRYPTDEQIIAYSKYAKVLEMHSWVWQNRYDENAEKAWGDTGEKYPLWADNSYQAQYYKWIPDNEVEFRRVINTAHRYDMKIVPYVNLLDGDIGIQMAEMKRLKDTYNIDGLYIDGLYPRDIELAYHAAQDLRNLFGEDGWLTLHNTHPSGYWAPFINTYMDLIITSEHSSFNRWTSTSYKISNAIASVWPEIPLDVKDGRKFLKKVVDDSLFWNNRVILMTGEQGQWRDWRLYFTPEEMEFMKEYYIGLIGRMKKIGYEKFISEPKTNKDIPF